MWFKYIFPFGCSVCHKMVLAQKNFVTIICTNHEEGDIVLDVLPNI